MAQKPAADEEVLPFNLETPREGVGAIVDIVALSGYTADSDLIYEGRCERCGYDRGVRKRHTEVPGELLECHNCQTILYRED